MKVVVDFHKLKWILFTVYYYSVKINFYPRANGAFYNSKHMLFLLTSFERECPIVLSDHSDL
jgi:hypothetical protein